MKRFVNSVRALRRIALSIFAVAATSLLFHGSTPARAAGAFVIPSPSFDPVETGQQTVVLAGGCFWGVQGVFQHVAGVVSAVSGYDGGKKDDAHYEIVSTGATGHAESVRITFDPKIVSFGRLLQIYFSVAHDPTEVNRQGPDQGTQYRSAIFPTNDLQAQTARAYIAQLDAAKIFSAQIATKIEAGKEFFPAEGYHQNYLTLNPTAPYIIYNDLPKIAALKKLFPANYRATPVLVPSRS